MLLTKSFFTFIIAVPLFSYLITPSIFNRITSITLLYFTFFIIVLCIICLYVSYVKARITSENRDVYFFIYFFNPHVVRDIVVKDSRDKLPLYRPPIFTRMSSSSIVTLVSGNDEGKEAIEEVLAKTNVPTNLITSYGDTKTYLFDLTHSTFDMFFNSVRSFIDIVVVPIIDSVDFFNNDPQSRFILVLFFSILLLVIKKIATFVNTKISSTDPNISVIFKGKLMGFIPVLLSIFTFSLMISQWFVVMKLLIYLLKIVNLV